MQIPKQLQVLRVEASSRQGGKPDVMANRLFTDWGFTPFAGSANRLSEGGITGSTGAQLQVEPATAQAGTFEFSLKRGDTQVAVFKGRYYSVNVSKDGIITIRGSCAPELEGGLLSSVSFVCPDPAFKKKVVDDPRRLNPVARPAMDSPAALAAAAAVIATKSVRPAVAPVTRAQPAPTSPAKPVPASSAPAVLSESVAVADGHEFVGKIWPEVRLIYRFEDQPRKRFNQERLQRLGDSIKRSGLKKLIQVRELDPSEPQYTAGFRYMLVDGERRLMAHKLVGLEKVHALLVKVRDAADHFATSLILNLHHEPHSHYELALAVIKLVKDRDGDVESVAIDLGQSTSWVYLYLGLRSLHPELFALLDPEVGRNRILRMGHASILSKIVAEHQLAAYAEAKALEGKGVSAMTECLKGWLSQHKSAETATGRLRRKTKPADHSRIGRAAVTRILASAKDLKVRSEGIITALAATAADDPRRDEMVSSLDEALTILAEIKRTLESVEKKK